MSANADTPTTTTPGRRSTVAVGIAMAIVTAVACYLSLWFTVMFEDPASHSLWFVYSPPLVATVLSLFATLAGRPVRRWIAGSVFAGTLLFWVAMGFLVATIVANDI